MSGDDLEIGHLPHQVGQSRRGGVLPVGIAHVEQHRQTPLGDGAVHGNGLGFVDIVALKVVVELHAVEAEAYGAIQFLFDIGDLIVHGREAEKLRIQFALR